MKRMIIAVLVLVGLLVAVDFGAAAYAESAVSRQMRQQLGLQNDPSVRINGFPFLTQALSGRYNSVDVVAQMITYDNLRELEVRAHLEGVTAPLSDLVGSGTRNVRVDRAYGTVRVGARDLQRLIPGIENLRIENLDADALRRAATQSSDESLNKINPDKAARLVGDYTLLGRTVEISTIAVLRLEDDGRAAIEPRDLRIGGASSFTLPSIAQAMLRDLLTVRFDPGRLPLNVTPNKFQAVNGGLEISGTTAGVVLGSNSTGSG